MADLSARAVSHNLLTLESRAACATLPMTCLARAFRPALQSIETIFFCAIKSYPLTFWGLQLATACGCLSRDRFPARSTFWVGGVWPHDCSRLCSYYLTLATRWLVVHWMWRSRRFSAGRDPRVPAIPALGALRFAPDRVSSNAAPVSLKVSAGFLQTH